MAKRRRRFSGQCAYCDVVTVLTEDHVIPRCLFPDKRVPGDIPIVYACQQCNNSKKNLDDSYLRDLLVVDADSSANPLAQSIFYDSFMRAARNTKQIQSPIARMVLEGRGNRIPFYTPGGIYIGEGFSVDIPQERVHRIFATIVHGLFFSYVGRPLPQPVKIGVRRPRDPKTIDSVGKLLASHGGIYKAAGDGKVFQCVYGVAVDRPNSSLWLLCFYQRIVIAIDTRDTDAVEVDSESMAEKVPLAMVERMTAPKEEE